MILFKLETNLRVLNGGRYYWEINVSQRIFGTSMMFGIGTRRARWGRPHSRNFDP